MTLSALQAEKRTMAIRAFERLAPLLASIAIAAVTVSCSDDDDTPEKENGNAARSPGQGGEGSGGGNKATAGEGNGEAAPGVGGSAAAAGGGDGGVEVPIFAMTTNVWGTEGATGYLFTLPSLAGGEPTLDNAIEVAGGAWLTGVTGEPYVYVSSGEGGPTITRYEVTETGELKEGPTVSFAGLGITSGIRFGTAPIVSATKAYMLDVENGLVVTWNPRDMKVGKVIDLGLQKREGIAPTLTAIVAREDQVFVTAAWESDWKWRGGSRLIAIDPATTKVVASEDDTRCEALSVVSRALDGTIYFGPQAFTAGARAVLGADFGTSSCALRIVPPGTALDQGWEVNLSELAGGKAAGAFMLATDDVGFFRVFYQEEIGATAETWLDSLAKPAYRWWRWSIGAKEAEEIPGQDLSLEASQYEVDGKIFFGNPSEDWSATTIVELDAEGDLSPGVTVQGSPGGIVRVQ
jgi:hypothetical protein